MSNSDVKDKSYEIDLPKGYTISEPADAQYTPTPEQLSMWGWGYDDKDDKKKADNNKPYWERKCECGTSITLGPKYDDPQFHSEWCPIYEKPKQND